MANSLVIAGNTMQRAFADGLALVVFFDEADGVRPCTPGSSITPLRRADDVA